MSQDASTNPAQHASFVIERRFAQPPARVFAAWADAQAKAQWFGAPAGKWTLLERTMEFRVGGCERLRGRWDTGMVTDFDARYHDIVPDRRIVYSYAMHLDERRISVSLATIEFEPEGAGTRLRLTEQGAFLDGYDDAGSRERGTKALLDSLESALRNG
ncbi:MAG TPA: SRPBCC family protein [Burkholderiales bacterium]|nr:SRPBCC family protein [Burkholderiales bacterium]